MEVLELQESMANLVSLVLKGRKVTLDLLGLQLLGHLALRVFRVALDR